MSKINVDNKGFVYADKVKVCRITPDGKLAFLDKNKFRCQERGSREVTIDPGELVKCAKNNGSNNQ